MTEEFLTDKKQIIVWYRASHKLHDQNTDFFTLQQEKQALLGAIFNDCFLINCNRMILFFLTPCLVNPQLSSQ